MKFNPIYIYGPLVVLVIVFLIVFTQNNNTSSPTIPGNINRKEMPNDSVHKNLQNPFSQSPSKSNTTEDAKHEVEMLKKLIKENPKDTVRLKQYADFLSVHKPGEAIRYYDRILKINPKREDILFALSYIYYNQGNLVKAEETTNKILSFDKNNIEAQYNIGAIAASRGDREKARKIWNKIITEHPNDKTSKLAKSSLDKLQ